MDDYQVPIENLIGQGGQGFEITRDLQDKLFRVPNPHEMSNSTYNINELFELSYQFENK